MKTKSVENYPNGKLIVQNFHLYGTVSILPVVYSLNCFGCWFTLLAYSLASIRLDLLIDVVWRRSKTMKLYWRFEDLLQ